MKILVVGMTDSVHLSRWLEQFVDSEHIFRLVPSSPMRRLDSNLRNLLRHHSNFELRPAWKFLALPLWLIDRFFGDCLRGMQIAMEAHFFSPDLVHVLELQNGGYSYLRARTFSKRLQSTPVVLTPYGSDLFWFKQFPAHQIKLSRLLSVASGISCECRRDEILATELGFRGEFLPRIPAFGSIRFPTVSQSPKDRNVIAVKGYQNRWGQAAMALQAIQLSKLASSSFEVVIFSCNRKAFRLARSLSRKTGLRVTAYRKRQLSHVEMQELFSTAIIYIGLSKSDGISASMIEAMVNGAIPIQSDSSCCGEWMDDGVGGFLVKYDDVQRVAELIDFIVSDSDFADLARIHNLEAMQLRMSLNTAHEAARNTYAAFESE